MKRPPGSIEQCLAGRGQFHRPGSSLEQRVADHFFEAADLRRQRRLRNVHPLRRAAEVQFFRHRYEVPKMP
jgi:hypothetical protein